jgi:hypothetical protein
MFDHTDFKKYPPEKLPLDCDIYLRDEKDMVAYEQAFEIVRQKGEWKNPGYVTPVAVRRVTKTAIELSWNVTVATRFHEIAISLPRDQVLLCMDARSWDEKPCIFVRSAWLEQLHLRSHCVFGFIDAAGVRAALEAGLKIDDRMPALREGIDAVAARYPNVSFISFADSVYLKGNWTAGYFERQLPYNYDPEVFLRIYAELRVVFRNTLGLEAYAVLTQGTNEFHGDQVLHISEGRNHVCLNAMGAPFADLLAIEHAARNAAKAGDHPFCDLYLDETYFYSLQRRFEAYRDEPEKFPYQTTFSRTTAFYLSVGFDELMAMLEPPELGKATGSPTP